MSFLSGKCLHDLPCYDIISVKDNPCFKGCLGIEDFLSFSKAQWADFDYKLSDGECLREVQERNIRALNFVLEEYRDRTIAVGSHGTALSTIVNYYDRRFGYREFERIRALMPWIVRFTFDGKRCVDMEQYDLFLEKFNPLIT